MTVRGTVDEIARWRGLTGSAELRDQERLVRGLESALREPEPKRTERLDGWKQKLDQSLERIAARRLALPKIELDESLPVAGYASEIAQQLRQRQVLILAGETGSGKSTQLPLIALQAGFGLRGLIGHTQPRRIAARSIAARVAGQLGQKIGDSVGCQVRFSDQSGPLTCVKLMTDGILLAETPSDRLLRNYELLIVDEAHERSLNVDFVLAWLKQLLPQRPELRVAITSATLDTQRFAEHFADAAGPAPVIEVEGRSWPVEIQYHPPDAPDDESVLLAVVHHCDRLLQSGGGDLLVFLPTEHDIRAVAKKLRGSGSPAIARADVLPLYGRLADHQQAEVFRPHSRPRIVLATNVAESSITVPGIRAVIDVGTARISRYVPRSKVQRLPIEPVSQASASQRAGRCGRVGPGTCIRLYSEDDFDSRPPFTTPEIRRTNLAGTLLRLLSLGVPDIEAFPLLDPPHPEAIRDGFRTLHEITAIDDHRRLTDLGRRLARMPVDPRIGRILVAADEEGCLADMLVIAAALETQDVRVRPAEKREAADTAHRRFAAEEGDFISLLRMWDFVHQLKADLSRSRFRMALEQNFLSPSLVNEWQELHRQLQAMIGDERMVTGKRGAAADRIHRGLLAGFLSGVALLDSPKEYLGAGGIRFGLWPGSALFNTRPKWILAGEVVETHRRYGRMIAPVDPAWIESLAEHLVKRSLADPFWSDKSESAMAYENVLLFGLPVVTRRRIGLARIDPATSRSLLIDEGLVAGRCHAVFGFHQHNLELIQSIRDSAARLRDRKAVVEDRDLARFYRQRLPAEAVDVRALRELLGRKEPSGSDAISQGSDAISQGSDALSRSLRSDLESDPLPGRPLPGRFPVEPQTLDGKLRLQPGDLGVDVERLAEAASLPDEAEVGSLKIPLAYQFIPGAEDDGVTVDLPLEAVGQLDSADLWGLAPQLLREQVTGLIRALPASLRRLLVPAPDVAERVLPAVRAAGRAVPEVLARELTRIAGERISPEMFDWSRLEPHLLVNLRVTGPAGNVLAQSRSLAELNRQLGPLRAATPAPIGNQSSWSGDSFTDWTWDDWPERIQVTRRGLPMDGFPALVDNGSSVSRQVLDTLAAAERTSRAGIVRLFQLAERQLLRGQVAWLPELEKHKLRLSRRVPAGQLEGLLRDLLVRIALVEEQPLPRTHAAFMDRRGKAAESIGLATQAVAGWLPKLVAACEAADRQLVQVPAKHAEAAADVRQQLCHLLAPGFLRATPWRWLQHFPRYLSAASWRLEKLPAAAPRQDGDRQRQVAIWWQQFEKLGGEHSLQGWLDPALEQFRWMIEEYRVSLFAQPLGTSLPVSDKRLEKQLQLVRRT